MSMTYTEYQTRLAAMATAATTDTKFVAILPAVIDYAEQRMYRELQLVSTQTRDQTGSTAIGTRTFTFPSRFVILDSLNLIVGGNRVPLFPASRDFIDFVYGAASIGTPTYYAMETDQSVSFGPTPDSVTTVEVVGKQRPAALSISNPSTFLSLYLPDAFLAASMVFYSGFQKNFSAQSSNPQQGTSWEDQYTKLMASAQVEELRKRFTQPPQ
jgi:hypothetical protein